MIGEVPYEATCGPSLRKRLVGNIYHAISSRIVCELLRLLGFMV